MTRPAAAVRGPSAVQLAAQARRHVTPEVLARLLGIRRAVVMRWVRSGALPALNITSGRAPRYRIFRADLTAFLRSRGATDAVVAAVFGDPRGKN